MSRSQSQYSAVAGIDLSKSSKSDLDSMFLQILKNGIHGISFSAYLEDQSPGSQISEEQVDARMKILQPYVKWVRSFSCVDGNEHIPKVAHKYGMKTLVGAWLGDDKDKNEIEIENIIKLGKDGYADIIAVGNEVLLRGDLTEEEIIKYVQKVKNEIPNVPVGYVDAYFEFVNHPLICNVCDVILANCYPFWEGYPIEHAFSYLKNMYYLAVGAAKGKKVLMFVDPPYYKADQKRAYEHSFNEEEHLRVAKVLKGTNHLFILTYDDCPEVRKLYSWANIYPVSWRYHTANSNKATRKMGQELIITNFALDSKILKKLK